MVFACSMLLEEADSDFCGCYYAVVESATLSCQVNILYPHVCDKLRDEAYFDGLRKFFFFFLLRSLLLC